MSNWTDYLASQGARFHQDEAAQVEDFGRTLTAAQLAEGFVAPVTDLGLISVSGDDAASFLHNQLTNDVQHLAEGEARLAGYCTPKGRLLATFLMWRDPQAIYLALPREQQTALQKRLAMYVLRAKAKLADATPEAMLGLGGAKAEAALLAHGMGMPTHPYGVLSGPQGTVVRLADAFGRPRVLWLTSAETAINAFAGMREALAVGGSQAWRLAA
ncbi:MAG TPA: folate-binding protein, partial [Telluria sp.]|nr:folate-binding protein [Telluria sp.]